jgi:hypothetical protein
MSSIPVRGATKVVPSQMMRIAAIAPSLVDRVSPANVPECGPEAVLQFELGPDEFWSQGDHRTINPGRDVRGGRAAPPKTAGCPPISRRHRPADGNHLETWPKSVRYQSIRYPNDGRIVIAPG